MESSRKTDSFRTKQPSTRQHKVKGQIGTKKTKKTPDSEATSLADPKLIITRWAVLSPF